MVSKGTDTDPYSRSSASSSAITVGSSFFGRSVRVQAPLQPSTLDKPIRCFLRSWNGISIIMKHAGLRRDNRSRQRLKRLRDVIGLPDD